ncbi:NAD-dependent deacylase [Sphingomonas abietis]|uniref:protein acetyllysine N-acetyltransferase n=1 Tax=Sphingomonas abietis TaxID=3012344 RepID=A0ABY7NH75_9SPHN|nr:NAD-dependent deacylase [Sphingomonas abietis]WBO20891.1 NAD-dependent deacylase [Sphingomonas abietis]
MRDIQNIVILTGAGVSAESGVPTFRTHGAVSYWEYLDADGVLQKRAVEEICTLEALAIDRALVLDFYDQRRRGLASVAPNAAHKALAFLDAHWPGELLIVTQNVDDLHERAGAKRMLHMHGELLSSLCSACGTRAAFAGAMNDGPRCAACGQDELRPDIVLFGEMPYGMERIEEAIMAVDLFVSIGTSGAVYPAAGFVQAARHAGADTLELNLEPSAGSVYFHETRLGTAGVLVPAWVDDILGSAASA